MSPFTCHAIVCYWPKREEGKENSCILCYTCSRKVQLMTFKCPTHWMNTYKGIIIGTDVNKSCPMWALLTFGAWKFFVGDRLVRCWICSSIPDLYTLDANSIPSGYDNQNVSRYCQMPREAKLLPGENCPNNNLLEWRLLITSFLSWKKCNLESSIFITPTLKECSFTMMCICKAFFLVCLSSVILLRAFNAAIYWASTLCQAQC